MKPPCHTVKIAVFLLAIGLLVNLPASSQHRHGSQEHGSQQHSAGHAGAREELSVALQRVVEIHGQHGPFAVAGYRMGEAALAALGTQRGSFELEVVHHSPAKVQWSCIADGLQAATGVSAGKLNLRMVETSGEVFSIVRNRKTGQVLRLELSPDFAPRFENLPYDRLAAEGEAAMQLPADKVFRLRREANGKTESPKHAH